MLNNQLANLPADDSFDYNPDDYTDSSAPKLVDAGVYLLKPLKYELITDRDGAMVFDKDESGEPVYPILKLDGVEIIEPEECRRKVMLFQRIPTKPFTRKTGEKASFATDFLRAFDQTRRPRGRGIPAVLEALDEVIAEGGLFRAKLDWIAKDFQGAKAEIALAEAEGQMLDRAARSKVYDRYECKGMFRFPKDGNGNRQQVWTSPSGEVIEARVEIVRYIPSREIVKLGPLGN